ncbi:ubiquitin specific protease 32 isoform X2 [Lycorma delicatula]|uniref:ubiquitin specific protease 32 isoform X2 n=1 Tax=Lycorma delicatula TaxID=130591 RepID=UPI003F51677D
MGGKGSKALFITYEDAVKKLSDSELKRLRDAFKRHSTNGVITDKVFIREVLGDGVPNAVAEFLFVACGGVPDKGIAWKELLCGLVLLTRGKEEEKLKFVFSLYSNDGTNIYQNEFRKTVEALENGYVPEQVSTLFYEHDTVTFEEFKDWLKASGDCIALNKWILKEPCTVSLGCDYDSPTFYQTLAGVTHLEEVDIVQLEKRYFTLKAHSVTGKLDEETLRPLISPPVPLSVCGGVFNAFDENRDNHIDFKEMACGISAATRGPLTERQKFCFKVFDSDHDGFLSPSEMKHMVQVMIFIKDGYSSQNVNSTIEAQVDEAATIKDLNHHAASDKGLTVEEYLMWTVNNPLPMHFLNLLFQVCHIVLGLRPVSKVEEGEIIRGWLEREDKRGFSVGQFWYLISMDWWQNWLGYTSTSENAVSGNDFRLTGSDCSPSGSLKRAAQRLSKRSLQNTLVENSVALENSNVVVTGITPLESTFSTNGQRTHLSAPLSPSASPNQSPRAPRRNVHPGLIDNMCLITPSSYKVTTLTGEGGKLKKNVMLVRGRDFELVPDSLWKALWQWYGGSPALPRQVIKPRNNDELELELYPVTLRLLRHVQTQRSAPTPSSWSSMVGGYGAAAALSKYPLIGTTGYTYVSNLPSPPKRFLAHTATFSRMATVKQVYEFLSERLHVRLDDMRLGRIKEEPNVNTSVIPIEDETATLEELNVEDEDQILVEVRNKDLTWPEEIGHLALPQNDKCRTAGTTEKGVTGLNNLGNTCFMNAALQCVSNTQILTQYFLNDKHLYELNRQNSMGMKGHIAKRYGDLIHDIWSGTVKTVAPLKLRWTIGKYAPVFTGTQQHDSQELLAFLLDGLHEDLNRVVDKPYTKVEDSDGRPDVIVAQESWEATTLRNRSIITDLFYGQLKSSITCSVCGYESAKFEAFNSLSLPLPLESFVHVQVIVLNLNGSVPVQYGLRLNVDVTFAVLKTNLSNLIGIPASLLKVVEVSDGEIKVVHSDDSKVKSQNQSCEPFYVYELPGDEERLSINSQRSQREAQTFTAIQRSIQPHPSMGGARVGIVTEESSAFPNISSDLESPLMEGIMSSESEMSDASERAGIPPSLVVAGQTDSGNCSASSSSLSDSTDAMPLHQPNYIIALHRKLLRQDMYFLSSTKIKPQLFGLPVIVPCSDSTTHQDLYQSVWTQVARLVTPLPPSESTPPNHAMDCDDSLGYEFPFVLKAVNKEGSVCAWCPWTSFCRGCRIQCSDAEFSFGCSCLAIDWDPTALHLRYQTALEKTIENHPSVMTTLAQQNEPINLDYCMEAFTKDEVLTDDEKYNCPKCKEFQLATKKLQIFRLPPIMIIHLKRFQFVNNRWVKSQKVVNVPLEDFDPTPYLATAPKETVLRHRRNLEVKKRDETVDEKSGISNDYVLKDFHQHQLVEGKDPFDLRYRLYAVLSHHGFLGTGHYIAYALNPNGKWYIYNDSSIKETATPDTKAAYLLFYEREGLSKNNYMPTTVGPIQADIRDMDDELDDTELKKLCVLM